MSGQTIFNFMDPPDGHTKPATEQNPPSQDTNAARQGGSAWKPAIEDYSTPARTAGCAHPPVPALS